jgi:hypothetical protein
LRGSKLDGWDEHFDAARWDEAMADAGLSYEFYCSRVRAYDEIVPWAHLDYGVSRDYLIRENKRAHENKTTPHCREHCSACGAAALYGEKERVPPCR